MENFKEKYGKWGLVLGATDGIGKKFAEALAARKMNVILVGRRTEALNKLGQELANQYQVNYQVVTEDLTDTESIDRIIETTKKLDVGFIAFVATVSSIGEFTEQTWEEQEKMYSINIISFLKAFHHYTKLFKEKNRGGIINLSSTTGLTGIPYIAQYGAAKSFIIKMTESVAYEMKDTAVDLMVPILGSTTTPGFLQALPEGEAGEATLAAAMIPEAVVDEIFENFGKVNSLVIGEKNREAMDDLVGKTSAEIIEFNGALFK